MTTKLAKLAKLAKYIESTERKLSDSNVPLRHLGRVNEYRLWLQRELRNAKRSVERLQLGNT